MPLDDLDRALIDALRVDGRASNRSLAETLGVNEATVGTRLRRLEDERVLRVVAATDFVGLGHEFLAFVKVRVAGRSVRDVGAELAEIPENIAVVMTIGRFDLVCSLLARDRDHLSHLVTERLAGVDGVDSLRTELALDVLKFRSEWGIVGAEERPEEPRVPTDQLDELDLAIIGRLQDDARSSNRSIASRLGVSEGTIRSRIRNLEDERIIRIQAITDPAAFGMATNAYVAVDVEGGRVREVAKQLADLEETSFVGVSLGDHDLWTLVVTPDRESLISMVVDTIGAIPGVRRTETAENVAVFKHSYTWARLI